jgi:hypothetical protein
MTIGEEKKGVTVTIHGGRGGVILINVWIYFNGF